MLQVTLMNFSTVLRSLEVDIPIAYQPMLNRPVEPGRCSPRSLRIDPEDLRRQEERDAELGRTEFYVYVLGSMGTSR